MATDPAIQVVGRMERFVTLLVAGGVSLVAGLWLVTLFGTFSTAWWVGALLIALGLAGLGVGIGSQVDADL
jgi:hypothetical protein